MLESTNRFPPSFPPIFGIANSRSEPGILIEREARCRRCRWKQTIDRFEIFWGTRDLISNFWLCHPSPVSPSISLRYKFLRLISRTTKGKCSSSERDYHCYGSYSTVFWNINILGIVPLLYLVFTSQTIGLIFILSICLPSQEVRKLLT